MQDNTEDRTKKRPDSSLKQEFLMRFMGEVRPVYGFWNQNAAYGLTQRPTGAKTPQVRYKITVAYAEKVTAVWKNRGFLSDTK